MALWRPCGRLIQAIYKLPASCQVEHIPGVERLLTRFRGYVTLAPRPGNAVTITNGENSEAPGGDTGASDTIDGRRTTNMREMLARFCCDVESGRMKNANFTTKLEGYLTHREEGGVALLRNCGNILASVKPASRRVLASRVWDIMRRDTSKLTLEDYNTLLDIHAQNKQPVAPKTFLDDMSVEPDDTTYKLLLNVAATLGDVQAAAQVLSMMKDTGRSLTEDVFNLLILTHANNGDIESVISMVDTMRKGGMEPSAETYANVACGYAAVGDFDNTMKILDAHPLSNEQILEIAKRLSRSNLGKHIPDVLKHVRSPVDQGSVIFLNTLMELVSDGRLEDAFEVMNRFSLVTADDEANPALSNFLTGMVNTNAPINTIFEFMNRIERAKNYPPAIVNFGYIDLGYSALCWRRGDLALAVFEEMHDRKMEVRPHYYWSLLESSHAEGETYIFRTLKHMICLNVTPDHDTIVNHVLPHINVVDAVVALQKLEDLGLELSKVFTPLICYLLGRGRLNDALDLCSKINSPLDFDRVLNSLRTAYKRTKDIDKLAKMLKYAPPGKSYPERFLLILFGKIVNESDAHVLNHFLRAFEAEGISVADFAIVKSSKADETNGEGPVTLVNPLDSRALNRIPHPRDMSLEQLECHLIELKSKGMHLRGCLRKLLQMHCRENNLSRVEELKSEYDKRLFIWTPGLYSSLLQLYAQNGRVQEALDMYTKVMSFGRFNVDDFRLINLATALVKENLFNEAFAVLESNSSAGGSRILRRCWELLDAVARSSSPQLTERMLMVLLKGGFCDVRNSQLLGPLVRAHLVRDDLASAVETFAECAKRHRCTPLRQELVCALVKRMNTDKSTKLETMLLLNKVQSITRKINGNETAHLDLLVALARAEMTNELRRFLQNNKIKSHIILQHSKFVPECDKLTFLTTLLDASEKTEDIDRISIYIELLAMHNRSGDCEKAVKLWNRFSAEAMPVSHSFMTVFEGLLTKHNVPLPEDFVKQRNSNDGPSEAT